MLVHRFAPCLLAGVVLMAAGPVQAQTTLRTREFSGVNRIEKGVSEIALDSLWILGVHSEAGSTATRLTILSGVSYRRFIRANLALSLTGGGFYRTNGAGADDVGGIGTLGANIYFRLGEGMFVAPGLGGGLLLGTRQLDAAPGMVVESSLVGGVVRAGLPFVFYAWDRFNLRAGLELIMTLGSATPSGGESISFTDVDGGFEVGFAYYF